MQYSSSKGPKFFSSRYRDGSCFMWNRSKLASLQMAPLDAMPQGNLDITSSSNQCVSPQVSPLTKSTFHSGEGLTSCFCLCRSLGTRSLISPICHHKEQGGQCHSSTVAKSSGNTYLYLVVWKQHRGLYSLWTEVKTIWEELAD